MTTVTTRRRPLARADSPARLDVLGPGQFEGYAAVFGVADGAGDVVAPGAFAQSLRARPPRAVRLLYQHFAHEPIGVWEAIREDGRGLYVRGRLSAGVQRAREVLALLAEGAIDGLSIGFRTRRAARDPATGHRILQAVELWEISIVSFPLSPRARILALGRKADAARALRQAARSLGRGDAARLSSPMSIRSLHHGI